MVILFWALRLILGFAAVAMLMLSWRATLTVATCLFFDIFGMIVAGASGAGLWAHSRLMLGVGLCLGGIVSIGRPRGNLWDIPLLALLVSILLSASWLQDRESLEALSKTWPAYVAATLALPVGCLCTMSAVDLVQRAFARSASKQSLRS